MIFLGVSVYAAGIALNLLAGWSLSAAVMATSAFVLTYALLGAFRLVGRLRVLLSNVSFSWLAWPAGSSSYVPWTDFEMANGSLTASSNCGVVEELPRGESPCREHPVPEWLGDALIESYVRWREESVAVSNASLTWRYGETNSALACALYEAALDREEAAARDYAVCTDQVRRHGS